MKKITFFLLTTLFLINGITTIRAQTANDFLYFEKEDGTIVIRDYIGSETDIIIPETINDKVVTVIGYHAFSFTDPMLTSVVIPNSITHIWDNAFSDNSITTIDIPNSVTYIGSYAFYSNELTTINVGNSVEYIGRSAFDVNNIVEVGVPNSIKHIEEWAFSHNSIAEIIIPNSVVFIGSDAFSNNPLTSFQLPEASFEGAEFIYWRDKNGNNYNGNSEVTELNHSYSAVFEGEHYVVVNYKQGFGNANSFITDYIGNETDITIPMKVGNDTICKIGRGAFESKSLTNVNIPNSIRTILHYSFSSNSLSTINIPKSVLSIYYHAFEGNLFDSIVLPKAERKDGVFEYWEDDEGNRYSENSAVYDLSTCYDACFDFQSQSINSLKDINLKVYPNPVTNFIIIESISQETIANIEIYCINGDKVYQNNFSSHLVKLDMSNFPIGTLLMKITYNDKRVIVSKILKE